MNGVSLTHGDSNNRMHIWTFAVGLADTYSGSFANEFCECVTEQAPPIPSFIGNDYFCESGDTTYSGQSGLLSDDPLWDGQNCAASSCCQFSSPPYFTKTLPAPTSDAIELRICSPFGSSGRYSPIDQVELYVKIM